MPKIRVYELAKEIGITSAELRAQLTEMGIEVKSASSSLDEATAATVRELLSAQAAEAPAEEATAEEDASLEPVEIESQATVRDFALALDTDVENVLDELERLENPHLPNQILDPVLARQVGRGWGFRVVVKEKKAEKPAPPPKEKTKKEEPAPAGPRIVVIEKEAGRPSDRRMRPHTAATKSEERAAPEVLVEEPEEEVLAEEEEEVVEEVEEAPPVIWRPEVPPDAPPRPAVITVMGHVDHGKTTLLDYIRKEKVTEGEAGGITQHIGAYQVEVQGKKLTFLDTPGHEAFTAIRARGARVTDIAILVVGADDGVMPQTLEAIDHARAAEVPIVVAMNKIDRAQANIDRVKRQLSEQGLNPVDWGGETEMIPISALDGTGVDALLDTVMAMAELHEYKGAQDRPAAGTIIESYLDRRRGPQATVIIQEGVLRVGDALVAGLSSGKVRMMMDEHGKRVKEALPSSPALIAGLSPVPEAGDIFQVVKNDKEARRIAEERRLAEREAKMRPVARTSLQDLYSQIETGEAKELNLVLKADAQGSLDAIAKSVVEFKHPEVKVAVLRSGIGDVSESDVLLAAASNCIIIGFQVGVDPQAKRSAADEKIEIRLYEVIYDLLEDVRQALVGLLPVQEEEVALGEAEVRALFRSSRVGTVAGCIVTSGKIVRNSKVRIIRDGEVQYTGNLTSLRHVKDDVAEMSAGSECGIVLGDYNDFEVGDIIESYEIREIRRQVL